MSNNLIQSCNIYIDDKLISRSWIYRFNSLYWQRIE